MVTSRHVLSQNDKGLEKSSHLILVNRPISGYYFSVVMSDSLRTFDLTQLNLDEATRQLIQRFWLSL